MEGRNKQVSLLLGKKDDVKSFWRSDGEFFLLSFLFLFFAFSFAFCVPCMHACYELLSFCFPLLNIIIIGSMVLYISSFGRSTFRFNTSCSGI